MDFQADPVTEPMPEVFPKPGFGNHVTGGGVDVAHPSTGANRFDGSSLSRQHNSIYTFKFGRDFTGDQNTRQVARVPRRLGAPVDQHKVTLLDTPLRRHRMRQGGARPDGHDRRKAAPRPPELSNLMLQFGRDLLLRLAALQLRTNHAEGTLSEVDGSANFRDFLAILDLTQLLDQPRGRPPAALPGSDCSNLLIQPN